MRKTIILFALFCLSSLAFSQNNEARFSASISGINSGMGFLVKLAGAPTQYVDSYSYPGVQFSANYLVKEYLSVGMSASWQQMGLTIQNYEIRTQFDTINSDIKLDLKRINISSRVLFHYVRKENVNMYSGLRLGWHRNALYFNTSEILYDILDDYDELVFLMKRLDIHPDKYINPLNRNKLGYQVVLYGISLYFNQYVGINAELSVGRPNFFSLGLIGRF